MAKTAIVSGGQPGPPPGGTTPGTPDVLTRAPDGKNRHRVRWANPDQSRARTLAPDRCLRSQPHHSRCMPDGTTATESGGQTPTRAAPELPHRTAASAVNPTIPDACPMAQPPPRPAGNPDQSRTRTPAPDRCLRSQPHHSRCMPDGTTATESGGQTPTRAARELSCLTRVPWGQPPAPSDARPTAQRRARGRPPGQTRDARSPSE